LGLGFQYGSKVGLTGVFNNWDQPSRHGAIHQDMGEKLLGRRHVRDRDKYMSFPKNRRDATFASSDTSCILYKVISYFTKESLQLAPAK